MMWYAWWVKFCDFLEFKILGNLSKYWFEILCGVHVLTWWVLIWIIVDRVCQ